MAYYARQRGHRVTVLERGGPEHDSCSLGNAGMVVPSHFVPLAAPGMVAMGLRMMGNPESPFYIKPRLDMDLIAWAWRFMRSANRRHVERAKPCLKSLHLRSRQCFEDLNALPGRQFGLVQKGLIMLCRKEETLKEESHAAEEARRMGIPAEVLTPEEAARLDPGVRMDMAGAVYYPKDCHLSPNRFMSELTRLLQESGVQILWNTPVTGWQILGGEVEAVRAEGRVLEADEYVIAGGAWSPAVARQTGLRLPMQAGKGYSLTLDKPRQLPEICSILTEARVAVTPMGTSLRVGGTMEIAGLDQSINERRVRGIIKSVPQYFPEFQEEDFRGVPAWSGLRPCTPDGLPYLGRTRKYRNLSVATGHAMMGLSLGPVTGQLMAEVLSDKTPSLDISLLDPERFG
jgi:D-amino-acid dehydrogenase